MGFTGRTLGPKEGEGYKGKTYHVNTESKYVHTDDYYDKDSPVRIIEELKLELAEEKQQNQQLKSQKINFNEEMRNLKDKFNMEKEKIESEMEDLKKEIEKIGSSGNKTTTPVKKVEDKPQLSEIEKHYKQEISDLENQIAEVEKKYNELRLKNSELVKKHKEALEKFNQKQKQYEELQKQEKERLQKLQEEQEKQKQQTPQSQPEKKDQLEGIKEGKNEFFYNKESVDKEEVQYLQERIVRLLNNREVEFDEVFKLHDFLQKDAGRRVFTFVLKSTMKKVPSLILSENSFELVLYLVNATLKGKKKKYIQKNFISTVYFFFSPISGMNSLDPVNYITARVLLKASKVIGRKINKDENQYLKNFISTQPIWQNVDFWEDIFWSKKKKKNYFLFKFFYFFFF